MELKKKKTFIVMLFFILAILFFNTDSYAGMQKWNSLDYDVTVNSDGSMDIIETWEVYISETNTLYKDFEISNSDDYEITNVKVSRVNGNEEIELTQIYEEQYHVDSGCYYGLQIDYSTFEIAWNVGLDNSSDTRVYKMYYTVENAVKIYNDCTEVYWQFLSDKNNMPGNNITGTIRLPENINDIENLMVWAHGDLTGDIDRVSNSRVKFSLSNLRSNTMIEVRIVTKENIYNKCMNIYSDNMLDKILKEEQQWAYEANQKREQERQKVQKMVFAIIIFVIVNICMFVLFLSKVKKYKKIGKELKEKNINPKYELEYFRDIPDEENATPARAIYMYNINNNFTYINNEISNIFSATMLDLALRGLIGFEVVSKSEIRIYLTSKNPNKSVILPEDELVIYNILKDAMRGKESITPKEFSKYASKQYDIVYGKLNRLGSIVQEYQKSNGKFSIERLNIFQEWNSKFLKYMTISMISIIIFWIMPAIPIGLGLMAHVCRKNSLYISVLSEKGVYEVEQWHGLKKYMKNYSLLDEKLVPDIVLWEKYLVYATAFGISKEVIKQLKVVHPEMFNDLIDGGNDMNRYSYWHIMRMLNLNENYFNDFCKSLEDVYNSARDAYNIANSSDSSGSGSGGGFSGGGGGRWRWW